MPTTGEVRFASYLKDMVAKVRGITAFTSESEEAKVYAALQDLAVDLNLMIEADNPKRAIVGKMITDQVAYYNVTRVKPPEGKTTRSRQATAGHVADMLDKIYPILEVDPQVLVREVEVPRTAAAAVPVPPVPAVDRQPAPEKAGTPWGLILGAGAVLFLGSVLFGRK